MIGIGFWGRFYKNNNENTGGMILAFIAASTLDS